MLFYTPFFPTPRKFGIIAFHHLPNNTYIIVYQLVIYVCNNLFMLKTIIHQIYYTKKIFISNLEKSKNNLPDKLYKSEKLSNY